MNTSTSPTYHAAFRSMLQTMDLPELEGYLTMINNDIVKYVQKYGDHRKTEDTKEYSEKLKIVAEEIKTRRQLRLELEVA